MANGSVDSSVIVQTGDAAPANAGILIMALRTPGAPVPMAGTGPVARMTETFEGLCRSASDRIGVAAAAFGDMLKGGPIEGVDLKLGFTFTAEGGIVICKGTTEASVEVTIKFRSPAAK